MRKRVDLKMSKPHGALASSRLKRESKETKLDAVLKELRKHEAKKLVKDNPDIIDIALYEKVRELIKK